MTPRTIAYQTPPGAVGTSGRVRGTIWCEVRHPSILAWAALIPIRVTSQLTKLSYPLVLLGVMMKAVLLDIPPFIQCWMDERARLDQDRSDEMWDGVLHMVPPAGAGHQDRGSRLTEMLGPLARASGLRLSYETGVFRPGRTDDYRVPDIVVRADLYSSARGVEGRAELVIEIRSPSDESWDKLPFFAEMGIPEVLILESSEPILLRLDRGGSYSRVASDAEGWIASDVLPFSVRQDGSGRIEVRTARETVAI